MERRHLAGKNAADGTPVSCRQKRPKAFQRSQTFNPRRSNRVPGIALPQIHSGYGVSSLCELCRQDAGGPPMERRHLAGKNAGRRFSAY
jgi:hypothetical protein